MSNQEEGGSKKGLVKEVKEWQVAFTNDISGAVAYLNEDPKAGPGEAMVALRPDGSVVVFQLF
jgi:hypothetical protein